MLLGPGSDGRGVLQSTSLVNRRVFASRRRVGSRADAVVASLVFSDPPTPEEIGERLRAALELPDLAAFHDLLDPDVRWGAPNDSTPSCRNRDQVLAWYRRGRDSGRRASVTELVVASGKVLVGLRIRDHRSAAQPDGDTQRWQVLTLGEGE